jgi:hypothetical protein
MSILEVGRNPLENVGNPAHILLDDMDAAMAGIGRQVGSSMRGKGSSRPIAETPISPADPRLTEAVIAAVKTMNALDASPTGIMGDGVIESEISAVDRLVHATNADFLSVKDSLDRTRLIRFGLFADNWMTFKDEMKALENLRNLNARRLASHKQEAIAWAHEAVASVRQGRASGGAGAGNALGGLTWKRFFIAFGALAACIFGAWIFLKPKEPYDPENLEPDDLGPYGPHGPYGPYGPYGPHGPYGPGNFEVGAFENDDHETYVHGPSVPHVHRPYPYGYYAQRPSTVYDPSREEPDD